MTTIERRRLSIHVARISVYKAARFRAARAAMLHHAHVCNHCKSNYRCDVGNMLTDNIPRLTWTRPGDWRDSNAERP